MIKELIFRNWGPFRGDFHLNLKKQAYAITAFYESDPGRSNWGGKSMILEGIDFAVTGRLNPVRRFLSDGWITNGEKTGLVKVVFGDGAWISREKTRGQSTQIRFRDREGQISSQAKADLAVLKYIGFGQEDFRTIGYFESKQMSWLIRTAPEKRLDIVRKWLGLEKADRAETLAGELAKARVRELNRLKTQKTTIEGLISSTSEVPKTKALEEEVARVKEKLDTLHSQWQLHRDLRGYQKTINEYEDIVERGKGLAEKVTKIPADLANASKQADEELAKKNSLLEQARTDAEKKKKVALGLFDGRCPVAPIECPAKKKINDDRETSRKAFDKAKEKEEQCLVASDQARRQALKLSNQLHDAKLDEERLESLRDRWEGGQDEYRQARKALKKLKRLPDEDTLRQDIRETQALRDQLVMELARAKQTIENRRKWKSNVARVDEDIRMEKGRLETLLASKAVFRATQRRIAEKALDAIAHRANTMLQGGGVDLSIDVRWEREGSKLAATCEMCGKAFPSSTKIKLCEECGAERGQHTVQKLEFVLSDRSDAADDFAGISLQLAAGSWLLRSKDSPWRTAMIDEPFAAMDRTNRRIAANQLLQIVGSSAYKQLFVISHSQETVDVYGSQIRVIILRDGTRKIEIVE